MATEKRVKKKAKKKVRKIATPLARFRRLEEDLNDLLLNRAREIRGMLLALLARVHILLLGPPGTAKSRQVNLLQKAVKGSDFFSLLLTRFSLPEEVNGPLDVPGLQEGRYERIADGYLPTAHFGFLDEIFKANSSILNSLLQLINEREYRQGTEMVRSPLEMLVGASNELPESRELDALYDRFLLRFWVDYLPDRGQMLELLTLDPQEFPRPLALDDIHAAQEGAADVEVPSDMLELLLDIRELVSREGFLASDRRWKACVPVLKANAWLEGRKEVTGDDMLTLADILWTDPKDRIKLHRLVSKAANPLVHTINEIVDIAKEQYATIPFNQQIADTDVIGTVEGIMTVNTALTASIDKIKQLSNGSPTLTARQAISDLEEMSDEASRFAGRISGLNL